MSRVKRLTLTAACAVAIACPVDDAAGSGSPLGYAITAVGFRSYFIFDASPGETVRGTLRVVNLTSEPRTIVLAPVDVSTAAAGGLQYGNGRPHREGRWLTLTARSAGLPGSGSSDVPFAVKVGRNARPGEHFLGIAAVDRRVLKQRVGGRGPIRLRVIPRLAMTIEVRLPGKRKSMLSLGAMNIAVAPSGATLAMQISNPANTLISETTGSLTVSQGATPLFTQDTTLAAFVPKTAITYHVPWVGTPVEGNYRVKGVLRPAGARPIVFDRTVRFGGGAIRKYRQQTGRQAEESSGTPIVLLVVLGLALALAVTFGFAYIRARRQLRDRG
ncbi:MAG TPA: hypothetical protein VN672_09305 [Solirubrobacteraceae bacterium]|nr:hypothetical protein [Solirubrobacteraceae bacterium]